MRHRGCSESQLEAKKRASSQSAGTSPKRQSRSRSRGLSAGENQNEPKAEPPHRVDKSAKKWSPLNWFPGPEEEFPVHLAIRTKAHAFILWAENYKLNPECYKVQALQFIPNHVEVTGKVRGVGNVGSSIWYDGRMPSRGRRNRTTCESVQGMDGSGLRPGLNTGSTPSRRPGIPASFIAATSEL